MDKAERTYVGAGVDIGAADRAKELIKKHARSTLRPGVLSDIGFFGGLFELKGYREPVLVSSTDGVGTKLKISAALGKHNTVGIDLVNHCVDDILTCGAEPLFFLDYIAMGKLIPETVGSIVEGISIACKAANCALIGGETAEMPGLYAGNDYDLVGFIVGAVEKTERIDGKTIEAGDAILGLPSSGLHTNGYSLVRQIFGVELSALKAFYPELGRTLGEELLEPHRCYYPHLKPALRLVKGLAHITGGGLPGNVPRVLPPGVAARFNKDSWPVPPIFSLIQRHGNVPSSEMYRVFNMGVGMVVLCSPRDIGEFRKLLPEARLIGEVVKQKSEDRVIIA
ncbi:MAG: phosphoribosylformylglycinamidine cyclo-ligase [Chloroflexi bacterium]|nr:phosphoribosylformylglycinamidine cyclo-ligase [Chloroflexota bacterium]